MRRFLVVTVAAVSLAVSACTAGKHDEASQPAPEAAPPALTLAVTPATGTGDLPISTELGLTVEHGQITNINLADASGAAIGGMLRDPLPAGGGATTWIPVSPLAYGATYTATVTAEGEKGQKQTQTTTFTTMGQPGRQTGTGLYLFDGETVGVAMPVVIEFDREVPDEARAEVQKRLFVQTNPPQPGVWHWASGRQVWYRAPNYWQPGTTITVRSALAGVPMGGGSYGDSDRTATAVVGNKVFMNVDNATKQMQVYIDDQLAQTIPVSLGKPSTPSSSGAMVLMSKEPTRTFDTRGEPNGGYVVDVNWAMRLTWGGEFVHAAPWSVGDQGVRNVSHGCVNMANSPSQWLFDLAHIGDPIIVRGTEVTLENGNGWTAWNQTWADYIKGSALPVPPSLASAVGIDPLTGALPPPPPASGEAPVPAAQPTR